MGGGIPLKRSAPIRRTPLRPGTGRLKARGPAARRKPTTTPSPSERSWVLNRDRQCVVWIVRDAITSRVPLATLPELQRYAAFRDAAAEATITPCENQWGDRIELWTLDNLTYGHVRRGPGGGRPRADDGIGRMFAVAECLRHNLDHWESGTANNLAVNALLDALYPDRRQYEP